MKIKGSPFFHHLFSKKITIAKWQFNLFGMICLSIGSVVGFYLTVSNFIMPIFADTATSISKETDTDFSQGTLVDTEISGSGNGAVVQLEGGGGSDWYSGNWQYRKKIIVDHTKVDGDLTNFPVLVSLDSDSDLAVDAQDDFDDILFADVNKTKLDHEIEEYDESTGQLIAWVRVLSLSSSADTDIYLYYGNGSCSNQEDAEGVWDDDYEMVQHLEETSGTHQDSTSNDNDGSPQGSVTQDAAGKIDGADEFNNVNGTDVLIPSSSSLNAGSNFTIETWFRPDSSGGWDFITGKSNYWSSNDTGLHMYNGRVEFYVDNCRHNNYFSLTAGNLYHIVGVYDGSKRKLYVNNDLKFDSNCSGKTLNNSYPFTIGSDDNASYTVDGMIDEVRISSTARSAEWISASYENQDSPSFILT